MNNEWVDIEPGEDQWVDIKPEEDQWVDIKPEEGEWVDIEPVESKQDLGFWERKRLELEAKTGDKTSMGELAVNKTIGFGIDELSETVDEYSEQRLMKGEEDNPLKMVELARRIGLTQEQIDEVTAKADSGARNIFGMPLNQDRDVLKQGFAELAKAKVAERVRTREAAQQRLANAEEQSTMGAIASGVVDMASMPLKFANPATIGATTMINIGNRAGALQRDTYTLDEDGNPVLVKEGDSGAAALAKGTAGGVAETLVWTKLNKIAGALLKPVGKAISKIPGVGKLFDDAVKGVTGAGEKLAAKLGKSEGGRLALKTVDVLGDIEDKIHLGSLPGMVVKTRITEFLDDVVGLNAQEGEREKLGEWLDKVTSVEDNVRLLTGLIGFHAITAGVGAYKARQFNKEFRGTGREEVVGEFIGADRAKRLSNEDLEMMYRIVTSPELTAEKAGEFLDGLKGDLKAAGEQLKGELEQRREITSEQEEKLDAKIAEYAGGNEAVAEKVKADILSKMQDSRAIDMPDMLDEMVAMSAREYEPEARRLKAHDLRGSSKTEAERLAGIEELGVTSWEAAEAEGLTEKDRFGRYSGGARRALHIAIEGTEKLKAAVKAGEISGEMAEELLTAAQCELGARPPEERAALIDGVIDRAKGDEALARRIIRRLEVEENSGRGGPPLQSLEERLDRAAAEAKVDAIKERNPGASDAEARGAAVEPVETEDGRMTTLGEVVGAEGPGNWDFSRRDAESAEKAATQGTAQRVEWTKPEIEARDNTEGTNVKDVSDLVEDIQQHGKPSQGGQKHYKLAKTPAVLKQHGLTGDYFTIKTGVIFKHYGKDADHTLTASDWANISESLSDPLVVARYSWKGADGVIHRPKNSYSIWTQAVINGKFAMVGVEVKSPGKEITVNSITTVYGDEHISLRERDVVYSRNNGEGIRTLLNGPNPRQYSESLSLDKSLAKPAAGVKPQSALEGVEMAERLKGTKLKAVGGGWMTTEKFPELRVSVSSEGVEAVGLSAEMMAKPENTADVAAVLAQLTRIAKRNGVGVMFPDQASADIAAAIVREVKEQGLAKAQAKLDTRSKLFNLLFKTALGTGVTYDEAGFKEGLAKVSNGRQFIDKHGNIYGFVDGEGGIHFNPVALNFNTPIHEYGHLALEAIKGFNNKLWQRGMDLVKESDYYREIERQSEIEGHEYSYLKGKVDQICDEALATLIGDRGERLVTEKGVEAPLKAWLKEFWKAFKGAFGLADLSDEQVERMTLAEFADAVNAELLRGSEFGVRRRPSGLNRREAAKLREKKKEDQHWADEAARAEAEERERFEKSGMSVIDYVRSRAEEGEPPFDIDWEIARELANDMDEGRFAVGGRVAASNMGIKGAAEAEAMEKTGADREKIWRETGWWKGKDGKWRFELPRMRREAWHGDPEERHFTGGGDDFYRYRLTELVKNDDFFKAYPQAKKITVEFHKGMPTNVGGNFNEATLTIKLPQKYQVITDYAKYGLGEGKAAGLNAAGAKTIEHELQHAVQLFESFAKGGSPSDPVRPYALDGDTGHALSVFAEANGMDVTNDRHLAIIASNAQKIASDQTRGEMSKRLVEAFEAAAKVAGKTPAEFSDEINRLYDSHTDSPMGQYFKLAGEVEARNAQFRANMTPEERAATPPWETEDVPESRQIVKFAVGRAVKPSALGDGKQRYYEVPFDKAVDKIVKNKKPIGNEQVFVSETPKVFADIGFARLPIMMTQKHVLTISSDAAALKSLKIGGNAHDMKAVLKQVPKAIQKPLMVIASETRPDSSVVAITQLKDRDGKTVIVPIALDGISPIGNGGLIDSHIITSTYGKGNVWSKLVEDAVAKETNGEVGVFYIDTARANVVRNQLARAASGNSALQWLQLPRGRQNPDFVHSIADEGSPVKGGIVSQTATRQFKNWFGGSKVVDANGEPLVVYRGSEYDPLAQETGKGVIKPEAYFTADPEYAKRYTGNGGKVQAYYLNIRRPFDIRDPECLADLKKVYPDHEFQKGKSGALDWAEASTIDGEFLKENFGDKYDGIIYDEGGDPGESGVSYRGISYVPLDGARAAFRIAESAMCRWTAEPR